MSFEEDLRHQLHERTVTVPLPLDGPDRAMARSRQRDHRRRATVAIAAVAVLGVGTVGVVQARSGPDGIQVASQGIAGAQDLGPLALTWQTTPDGISSYQVEGGTVSGSGALYRLSTAPGTDARDFVDGQAPSALYRLADDGTWEAVSSGADLHQIVDVGAAGDLLYGMSTSPVAGGAGFEAVLSSSSDGGASWQPTTTLSVDRPSDVVDWRTTTNLQVEGAGDRGVALLSTTYDLTDTAIASSLAGQGVEIDASEVWRHRVRNDADGVAILAPDAAWASSGSADDPASTVPPTAPALGVDEAGRRTVGPVIDPATHVIGVIPWSALGLTGPSDMEVRTQLLVRDGDGWNPVELQDGALDGVHVHALGTLGSQFVIEGWVTDDNDVATQSWFVSDDGAAWREVHAPSDSRDLLGVGSAWVSVPLMGGSAVHVSLDQGTSWQDVDLSAVDDRLEGTSVGDVQAGPLGLAATVYRPNHPDSFLVVTRDLVNWAVTPMSEVFGSTDAPMATASLLVGADRIVVTGQALSNELTASPEPPALLTAIGTPTRS